jgi:glycosyltransferase involved in cell wall biosynthesis
MVPSILGMAGALAAQGEVVSIVTTTSSRLGETSLPERLTLRGPEADLDAVVRGAEVVHIHGLWQRQTRRGARTARDARVPYVITTHGMADPWALRHKAWKKKLYTALVERKNLNKAACLHALSRPEITHLRALAPRAPVCFVPNGVDLGPFNNLPLRAELEAEIPHLAGRFLLLFFGRIHVKKGLDLLAHALGGLANEFSELHVLLAGNDDGALDPFWEKVHDMGLAHRVTWLGHVQGERARRVWGAADAFILPSYSEGFSMAILEALASRLPVVITTACHFPELALAEGGLVVEPTADAVLSGVRSLVERTSQERSDMGRRGRALVERDYTWQRQGQRLAAVYRWIAGGGMPPDCVV